MSRRTGSTLCPACGKLVGVNDEECFHCGRKRPGMWGLTPKLRALGGDLGFVNLVLVGCGVLYLLTLVASMAAGSLGGFFSPGNGVLARFGASGALPVFGLGRWWTVLSAGWLHGGVLHILFNLMWLRNLGPTTAAIYGPARMVLIYIAGSIGGFGLSSLAGQYLHFLPAALRGASLTVGASAPIFGLLAALIYYGRRGGSSIIGQQAKTWALILLVFGLLMPRVDNWAHLGGFVGGWLGARWLDPLRPERPDHILLAVVGLVATVASIVASLVLPIG